MDITEQIAFALGAGAAVARSSARPQPLQAPIAAVPRPGDPATVLVRVRAEKCRRSLAEFVRQAWTKIPKHAGQPIEWNWHNEAVCAHIQALIEEVIKARRDRSYKMQVQNLIVNIPPRSGKTMMITILAQVWAWIDYPELSFRCCSGNPRVSDDSATHARDLINSEWFQTWFTPKWSIRDDSDSLRHFRNTAGGERRSSSFDARVTGEGTDILFIDDPHDAEDVRSDVKRERVLSKYDNSLHNRVNDEKRCARVLVMQRLHEMDLTGHLLANKKKSKWQHVKVPTEYAIKNECKCSTCVAGVSWIGWRDPRCTNGELLHPERFDEEWVEREKERLGSYGYAGQHDQNPAPADGGRFKWKDWRFWKWDGDPDQVEGRPDKCYKGKAKVLVRGQRFDRLCITADCAFKDGDDNDRVAMFVIGTIGADRYVLDRRCARLSFGATKRTLRELAAAWPLAMEKLVEDKANGTAVIDDLASDIPGLIGVNPEGGKEARAATMEPTVEAGNWHLPDGAPWLEDFCGEFAIFPNGAHDDQVDACSQASIRFIGSSAAMRARALGSM